MSANSESTATLGTVILQAALHARPAGQLAQLAAGFQSAVLLEHADRTADPRGILAVMSLGATAGSAVTIRAEGPDAEHAVQAIVQLLSEIE